MLSSALDSEQESEAESRVQSDKETQPEGLRLDADTYHDLLFHHTDWRKAEDVLNGAYVEAFDQLLTVMAGFPTRITYESMDSPRQYNFTTDRVYVHIPKATVRKLFAISKADGHTKLRETIESRCTDRPGFFSHYSNKLTDWLAKPRQDWDHNELETLLRAIISLRWELTDEAQAGHDFEWGMYYRTTDDESVFNAFQAGVDWDKFDAACAEKRGELEDALRIAAAERGEPMPEPRCDHTPDLFSSPPTGNTTIIKS